MWPPPAAWTTSSRLENSSQTRLTLSRSTVLIAAQEKVTLIKVRGSGRPSAEKEIFGTSPANLSLRDVLIQISPKSEMPMEQCSILFLLMPLRSLAHQNTLG